MVTTMGDEVIGREEELERLRALLDGRELDGRRVLVLEGKEGIGKSTLRLRGLEFARERGVRVLCSRPAEAERDLALVGLGDLFDGVFDEVLPSLRL
jgi:predicted ATPase